MHTYILYMFIVLFILSFFILSFARIDFCRLEILCIVSLLGFIYIKVVSYLQWWRWAAFDVEWTKIFKLKITFDIAFFSSNSYRHIFSINIFRPIKRNGSHLKILWSFISKHSNSEVCSLNNIYGTYIYLIYQMEKAIRKNNCFHILIYKDRVQERWNDDDDGNERNQIKHRKAMFNSKYRNGLLTFRSETFVVSTCVFGEKVK